MNLDSISGYWLVTYLAQSANSGYTHMVAKEGCRYLPHVTLHIYNNTPAASWGNLRVAKNGTTGKMANSQLQGIQIIRFVAQTLV